MAADNNWSHIWLESDSTTVIVRPFIFDRGLVRLLLDARDSTTVVVRPFIFDGGIVRLLLDALTFLERQINILKIVW